MKRWWMLPAFVLLGSVTASAEIHTESVEYQDGATVLEGYLAYDSAGQGKRPGILVVHEWMGLGPYAKRRAEQLARLGYVAFAADMYGKGVYAKDHEEAAKLSGLYRNDRQLARARINAAYDVLVNQSLVDATRIGAIGYCFGGMAVLELARSGANVRGVVTFHGALSTPTPADAKNIKGRVLVCQGGEDRFTIGDLDAFKQEMEQAGVPYQVIVYPGAVHSFTVPEAGNDPSTGAAYNPEADQQSWKAMQEFFRLVFGAEPAL